MGRVEDVDDRMRAGHGSPPAAGARLRRTAMKQNRIVLDPDAIDDVLQQLAVTYDLDSGTLEYLGRIIALYPRPVTMYVDESSALFYGQTPLVDRFTFNLQADELVLFASDPLTFLDATIEMAMYLAGFATMLGVEEQWKVEFTIGAWKPVRSRIKRELGIPVIDEPLWIVGLPPEGEGAVSEEPHPFLTLVSRLDIASFTQMVRLAARDDVEVSFPAGADPRVIEVYLRVRAAIEQVARGISLTGWREFNRRLLLMVQELEAEYQPASLPIPHWWRQPGLLEDAAPDAIPEEPQAAPLDRLPGQGEPPAEEGETPSDRERWDPFAAYLDELLRDEE